MKEKLVILYATVERREREIEKDIDRLIMIKVKMKIEMDRKRCRENSSIRVRRLEIMDCY